MTGFSAPANAGDLQILKIIPDGTQVKKGDVVVEFDPSKTQQDLAQDGYYQGPIDGIVGPDTQAAIAAYQRANGLPVTGAIDGNLLHSLGI